MTTIYCFSATGNTLSVARTIAAQERGGKTQILPFRPVSEHPDADAVGFLFPIYFFQPPRMVQQFLRNFPFKEDVYYFAVATCGAAGGKNAIGIVADIALGRDGELAYGATIRSVPNYIVKYNPPTAQDSARVLHSAQKQAEIIGQAVSLRERKRIAAPVPIIGKRIPLPPIDRDREFTLSSACNHCALCAQVCPAENISMEKGSPKFFHHCESCMACVHWCPMKAINVGKRTVKRNRYHHPDVFPSEVNN